MAGTQTRTGLEPSIPSFGGKCANQYTKKYTKIASLFFRATYSRPRSILGALGLESISILVTYAVQKSNDAQKGKSVP